MSLASRVPNFSFQIMTVAVSGVLFLALSSCQPKDTKVNMPPKANNTDTVSPAGTIDGKAENYKFLPFIVERQVEALSLYLSLNNANYAESQKILIQDEDQNGKKIKRLSLSQNKTTSTDVGNTSVSNQIFLALQDELGNLSIQRDLHQSSENDPNKKTNVSLNESSFKFSKSKSSDITLKHKLSQLTFTKLGSDGAVQVQMNLQDELNSARVGKMFLSSQITFIFKQLGDSNSFQILSMDFDHTRYGNGGSDLQMISSSEPLAVQLNSECVSVLGKLTLNSKELKKGTNSPLYSRELSYTDVNILVKAGKDNFSLPVQNCESRATVDLSRLL